MCKNIGDNLKLISYISGKNEPTLAKLCTLLKAIWEIANPFKVMVFQARLWLSKLGVDTSIGWV